jgi:hypothetical protein
VDGGVRLNLSRSLGWITEKGGSCSHNIRLLSHDHGGIINDIVLRYSIGEDFGETRRSDTSLASILLDPPPTYQYRVG